MTEVPRSTLASAWRLDALQLGAFLALLFVFTMACVAPAQNDTFWQLRAGRDALESGSIPLTDTYSHTVTGGPWPNHSWLWQVLAYLAYATGGFPVLTAANAVLAVLAVYVAFRTMRSPRETRLLILLLAAPLVVATYSLRPQVAATLLFAILMWLLLNERYRWVPALFLLWANVHGSVVIAGLVLVVVGILAAVQRLSAPTEVNRARLRMLVGIVALSALATLANPLGPGLWELAATSLAKARSSGVTEFAPAWQWGWIGAYFIAWCAVVAALAAARWRRLSTFSDQAAVVIAVALIPAGLLAGRNIAWAAMAMMPAVAALTASISPAEPHLLRRPHWLYTALAACASLPAALGVAQIWASPSNALGWSPVSAEVAAAVGSCPGPLYNTYNQGGYLIFWTPHVPVFIDSRYDPYPVEFVRQHAAVEASGDYATTFAMYGIACAALPPDSPTAASLAQDGWSKRTEDGGWLVLFPPSPNPTRLQ